MENPRYVIGASNENASGSYNNNGFANRSGYDENDLYEYDPDSSKGISGRVKDFLGSVQLKSDDDSHSTHQYKRDIIDSLCSQINQTLLIPKAFYFFFRRVWFSVSFDGHLFQTNGHVTIPSRSNIWLEAIC